MLGALPLSGVVSPFLSSGNTAMVANFLVFALLAGRSATAGRRRSLPYELLRAPLRPSEAGAGGAPAAVLLGFALRYQVLRDTRLPGARCARLRRRRRQAAAAQSAHQLAGARDSARQHLRPQRRAAGHQQLAGTGAASRGRVRGARRLARHARPAGSTAATIRSARRPST